MEDKLICLAVPAEGEAGFYVIENTLAAMQEAVGGLIETVQFAEDACIICNGEWRLLELPPNKAMRRFGDFVGDCLIVGVDGENFCSLRPGQFQILQGTILGYLVKQKERGEACED